MGCFYFLQVKFGKLFTSCLFQKGLITNSTLIHLCEALLHLSAIESVETGLQSIKIIVPQKNHTIIQAFELITRIVYMLSYLVFS